MAYLIDTNILMRTVEVQSPMRESAKNAIALLLDAGEQLCTVSQVISEFWNGCTRPVKNNGLGMTVAEVEAEVLSIESFITILPDSPMVYPEWRRLVLKHSVIGKQVHDARMAAAMIAHGIKNIVTFNDSDFKRYKAISAFTPSAIISTYTK